MTETVTQKRVNRERVLQVLAIVAFCAVLIALSTNTAFATNSGNTSGAYVGTIKQVLQNFIGILGTVFQAVGVVLAIWGFVQLVLAIRNDDPDSKSRASTQAIVGIVLLALPSIINTLGLIEMIGKTS